MTGAQNGALVIILIGVVLTIVCVAMPTWSKNDPSDTTRDSVSRINGLWIKCTTYTTGNWDCDDYDRIFLGLPMRLQAGRMLGIGAILFGVVSMFALIFGLDCVPIGGDDRGQKKKFRGVAGALGIASAGFILTATCWYANDIRIEHNLNSQLLLSNPGSISNSRFIFGDALFYGWAGAVCTLIGSLVVLCTACGGDDDFDNQPRGYAYHPPPIKTPNVNVQEYV